MVIRYVGNFREKYCTETHIANTLERLGHQVIRLQEDTTKEVVDKCDLFLFTRTWGDTVTLGHLKEYKSLGIPTASYHLDLYVGLREAGMKGDPFWATEFVFTPDGDPASAEFFKKKKINHFYIKPGVDKAECYMSPQLAFKHDVIFVGMSGDNYHKEWPYRGELLAWLESTYGERFAKYGHPQETVRNGPLNQLYAHTKVVVGDSLCPGFKKPYYWSDRVYETLGRGGFLIHPYIQGLDEEFMDGVHLAYYPYRDFKRLRATIDYFIGANRVREDIRKIGHEFVKEHATYDNRLKQMLEIVNAVR